jgi:hypothetical protein
MSEHEIYCSCAECVRWKNTVLADAPTEPPASEPPSGIYCNLHKRAMKLIMSSGFYECSDCVRQAASSHTELRTRLEALKNKYQRMARVDCDPANGSAIAQARGRLEAEFCAALEAALSGAGIRK